MTILAQGVNALFRNRNHFAVIGLTGRTGSGCSTAAELLSRTFAHMNPPDPQRGNYLSNEERKYRILYEFAQHNWKTYHWIKVSDVITSFVIQESYDGLIQFAAQHLANEKENGIERLAARISDEEIKSAFTGMSNKWSPLLDIFERHVGMTDEEAESIYNLFFYEFPKLTTLIRNKLNAISQDKYIKLFQTVGDNIRSSGRVVESTFNAENIYAISHRINRLIKVLRARAEKKKEDTFVVVDAIRNPFEAFFLRERYSSFYLIAVTTPEEDRVKRLQSTSNLNSVQLKALDDKEYPSKLTGHQRFVSQNIQKCIEISDIHINNPQIGGQDTNHLKKQLIWYSSLILHPGLVTPTATERVMQIAYTAKLNSGCISRQVGAVITDEFYSVKAVGWNNTPQGQVPCVLRNVEDMLKSQDRSAFSDYEVGNGRFRQLVSSVYAGESYASNERYLEGRNVSFCFKDIQNSIEGEKNQVHTRSLHAEENAFMQITKYGGEGIRGGLLFTTASPCELCAKKAYQLGIQKIVYVDPYPGITASHVLGGGSNRPQMELFSGAIGRAYSQLYQSILPYKDELSMLLDISIPSAKEAAEQKKASLEAENESLRQQLVDLKASKPESNLDS